MNILTPEGCTDREAEKAARFVASQAARLGAKDDLAEILAALGLAKPGPRVSVAVRDNLGRLRAIQRQEDPSPNPEPTVIPPGRHGHNGFCASGDHEWSEETIRREASGKLKCRRCEARRLRQARNQGSGARPKPVVDPDAPVFCKCPGTKHLLTSTSSESTYVDKRGQRQCRVGIARRKAAYQGHDDHQDAS